MKALFLDRDGIINIDYNYVSKIENFKFTDGIFEFITLFVKNGYKVFVVTNQSGIGRGYYSQDDFDILSKWMIKEFIKKDIKIEKVYYCPHSPEENCHCRKPDIGMIEQAIREYPNINLNNSYMVGDKNSDINLAINAKIRNSIFIGEDINSDASFSFKNIKEAYEDFKIQYMIRDELMSHKEALNRTMDNLMPHIKDASNLVIETLKRGNKILLCGNGGSAGDAQHISAELTGRYKTNRRALAGIALTTDTSAITAIANDFGYEFIFSRQVEALANSGDLLIGISTSGNSKNIILALKKAKELNCKSIGLSGNDGGDMKKYCDTNIIIPSNDTARVQEMHILIGHIICQGVDNNLV
ncbi:Phosphoheptose isomerase 1 [hydrothermal vent metagenome]|uniref:D-sedoheptulose-7-phosphate isomerase n=1 Tax=hydrothermal vent metagenome TaxID=652676 RepID=A0A1W1BSY0_9ZZZZ